MLDSNDISNMGKSDSMKKSIIDFETAIRQSGIDPEQGLGTDLFLLVSSLTPIINVDLFITDDKRRLLLSWRDDRYCGTGWHIPGGCLRFKEKLEDRIQLTAKTEIGCEVEFSSVPIAVSENIANDYLTVVENHNVRAHFISMLYKCRCLDPEKIVNCDGEHIVGHLKWFDELPKDYLELQGYYKDTIRAWFKHKQNTKCRRKAI